MSTETMPLHCACGIFVFLSACLISFTPPCDGGNILVFPLDGSHWINMKILLEELHARGHNITVIRPSNSWYIPERSPLYRSLDFEVSEGFEGIFEAYLLEQMRAQREGASALTFFKLTKDFLSVVTKIHSMWSDALVQLLDDEKTMKSLTDSHYDLVLTDPGIAQGVVLAKYLKLPTVLNVRWITSGDGHFEIAPSPFSYIPVPGSGLTDKMNFIQRVKNMLFYSIIVFQQKFMVGPTYDTLCEKYIEGGCDIISLLQEADIWLFRSDFVFDFPRPTMPNVIYIGGFQCKPAQPLPADLEDFVQSSGEHGVIIMTLGTLVDALPTEVADEIASIFAKMPQKRGLRLQLLSMETIPLHCACGIFVFLSACLISFTPPCDGGNILVFPVDGSHWINMKVLLEELHAKGHSITVIRSSTSWYIPEKSPLYTSLTLEIEEGLEDFFEAYVQDHMRAQREGASALTFFKLTKDFLSMISRGHSILAESLVQIFDDEQTIKSLIDSQYDLVLTDPAIAAGVVLAKYLKLPTVLNVRWITSGDGHFAIAPSPLSYIPVPGSGFTDKMNFIQRVKNMLFYSIILFQQKFMVGPSYDGICDKYIEGGCDIISLLQEADIWLFRSDFVFDFPRPTMPNVIYIGGFQCKPAQPLPADLEDFVQSSGEHGVIIMTLGTLVNALPKEVADEIASVFAKMPQKVIWKHKGERPSTLGNNTLIVDWMPQKDLLGHPQTKVFVAHGGTNGVQEAIYHGVPVLGIPLFFDQYDNLLRLQERGGAKIIKLGDVNGHSFEQGINEVLHQDGYRQNMQRLSRLHRDQPMAPMDQAIFWVEYVMRHKGAPHLRTEAYKMAWYSYYCLDVLLLILTAVTVLLLSTLAMFRFLCCRSRRKTKTKQN